MTNMPTSLPSITRPTSTDKLGDPGKTLYVLWDAMADELEAASASLGVSDGSTVSSLWEKVIDLTDGHTHDGVDSKAAATSAHTHDGGTSGEGGYVSHDNLQNASADDHHNEVHSVGGAAHTGIVSLANQGEQFYALTANYTHPQSDTTLADVTDGSDYLDFDVAANSAYKGEFELYTDGSATSDIKFALTFSSTGLSVVRYQAIGPTDSASAFGVNWQQQQAVATAIGSSVFVGTVGTGTTNTAICKLYFYIATGSNAGYIRLQAAQNAAAAANTVIRAGSHVIAKKVA